MKECSLIQVGENIEQLTNENNDFIIIRERPFMVEYRETPITLEEIREKLIRHYSDDISHLSRSMIVTIVSSDYGKPGNVLFTIIGSPPKGYGIYVPEMK